MDLDALFVCFLFLFVVFLFASSSYALFELRVGLLCQFFLFYFHSSFLHIPTCFVLFIFFISISEAILLRL